MKKLGASLFFAVALAACGGHKEYMRAEPVQTADVNVTPMQVWTGGGKLWVRVNVANASQGTLTVVRDAMTVHLGNGMSIGRSAGSTSTHNPYVIPPGASHAVYAEFEEQGFKWEDVPGVQVDFTNAITKDGQAVAVPPLVVAR
ncbi:MAG TPA: hypothetical protein VGI39_06340 [Polyangiaceae bacterium]|jgi:hypothetical protein